MNKLVAVTGASGHIGGNLCRMLLEKGYRIRALVYRDTKAIDGLDIEVVKGELTDEAAIQQLVKGVDCVFHLAAKISIEGDPDGSVYQTNVVGTETVVQACLKYKVRRLIFFSSIHSYNPEPLDELVTEKRGWDNRPQASAYNRSKVAGEMYTKQAANLGLEVIILNPTGVIGPYDFKPSLMGQTLIQLFQGKLPALVAGGFDWVDVRDICAAAIQAIHQGKSGENYILSGHWMSMRHYAALTNDTAGIQKKRTILPLWMAQLGAPFAKLTAKLKGEAPVFTYESLATLKEYRHISHERAQKALGYTARPLATSLKDTYNWFVKYRYL